MILPRLPSWRNAFRAGSSLPQPTRLSRPCVLRHFHAMPDLKPYGDKFKEEGVPGLLTAKAFKIAWTDYQEHILKKVNATTTGVQNKNATTFSTMQMAAREADSTALFNYASMAYNNHVFFNCLAPEEQAIPPALVAKIDQSFGSVDTLRGAMIANANAMFGPGFVWLVTDTTDQRLYLLNTYHAGTPYSRLSGRQQGHDMSAYSGTSEEYRRALNSKEHIEHTVLSSDKPGRIGGGGGEAGTGKMPVVTLPLLCVNTWEHVWLTDYGVAGKRKYLQNWWSRINWPYVLDNLVTVNRSARPNQGLRNAVRSGY